MPYGKEKNRKDVTKQAKNDNLHKAKTAKNDEFYTTKSTVEAELSHYWDHFKGKIVYCNCDDLYESEFFKYFMIRFNPYIKEEIGANWIESYRKQGGKCHITDRMLSLVYTHNEKTISLCRRILIRKKVGA